MAAYEHLVFFRFHQPLSPARAQELIQTLLAFKTAVPGILELSAGVNETAETDNIHGYTLGLRVTFRDRQALDAYGPHPVHQAFVQGLNGLVESVAVVDYPLPPQASGAGRTA